MNLQWYDWVGMLGTLMVLGGFFLLQAGRLHGNGLTYQLLNLFGAGAILLSLWGNFNISVFLLEAAWMAVSLYGIARTLRKPRPTPQG
ncbi:CBU_0592 family membrane protein [Solilutibacter tolerans]|uniref:CBU-0592-like domain-containing protein n=1 Tax=Solilutibacter tolerans TaxID=1604334 RepID=A0A1N6P6P6_9GAMM|nr:hypothetical protein [Lysobacter tolerans]SIP99926.1 hypothetical protein SAMN05421546_0505 [Lysobacter tolerans]